MAAPVLLVISVFVSTVCLGAGYLLSGYWIVLPALLLAWLLWFVFRKRSAFWAASGVFAAYLVLSAAGILLDLSLALMLAVGAASLVTWDLLNFLSSPGQSQAVDPLLVKKHLRSLGLAVSGGVMVSLAAALFNFQLSFGLVIVLALVAVGGFVLGVQNLLKN